MKYRNFYTLLLGIILTNPSFAADSEGGFVDINNATVAQAQNLKDHSFIIMQGNIISRDGEETYIFKDKTGQIKIEIDDDDWDGVNVSPEDLVEIQGQIDRGWTGIEIDVDTISKLAPQLKEQLTAVRQK